MPSHTALVRVFTSLGVLAFGVLSCESTGPVEPRLPDGLGLAFVSDHDGTPDIYLMVDGITRRLTNTAATEAHLVWSPDGRRLAFGADGRVWTMTPDGSEATALTDPPATEAITGFPTRDHPAQWSPSGSKPLYLRGHFEGGWLRAINASGTGDVLITEDGVEPSWSPDEARIALLILNRFGNTWIQDVFVMNADGTAPTNLTNSFDLEDYPSWSPDGATIAFSKPSGIYIVDPEGSGLTRLISTPGAALPEWSADSRSIAWSSGTDVNVVDLAGVNRQVARIDGSITEIIWSPTTDRIAFSAQIGGRQAVFVVKSDGSELMRIGNPQFDQHSPAWQPRPSP